MDVFVLVLVTVVVELCGVVLVVDFNFEPSKGPIGKIYTYVRLPIYSLLPCAMVVELHKQS